MLTAIVLLGFLVGIGLFYIVLGIFVVKGNEQRAVIELMGKYWRTVGPGLQWRPPLISSIRNWIDVREWDIAIFDEGDIKIDLVDGWIKPLKAKVFIRVNDPLQEPGTPPRAIYAVGDWKSSIKSLAETLTSSYLRAFRIEEVLQVGRGGFDIADQINRRSRELRRESRELRRAETTSRVEKEQALARLLKIQKDLQQAYAEIRRTEESWGIKITQIYIPDYELSPELRKARDEVHEAERRERAVKHRVEQMIQQTAGLHSAIKEELIRRGYSDPEKTANELWSYFRGTETGSIIDLRGSDSITDIAAKLVAVFKKMEGTNKGASQGG